MGRYRKILAAIDGSPSSDNALIQAFRLATDEKSWITVCTVVHEYGGDLDLTGVGNIHSALRRPGEEILARAAETARQKGALIKTGLEEGEVHERIVDLAASENCGVILLGRRGLSHLDRSLVGSVAARVIGYAECDVMVLPAGSSIGWKNILLATDGSLYSKTAADRAIDLARSYGGKISVVSVVDVPPEFYAEAPNAADDLINKAKSYVADVRGKAESAGVSTTGYSAEGEAYSVIVELAKTHNSDMIVMGSHGRTGLRRLLMGSVAEKVIGYSACPVLVVKT